MLGPFSVLTAFSSYIQSADQFGECYHLNNIMALCEHGTSFHLLMSFLNFINPGQAFGQLGCQLRFSHQNPQV